MPTYMIVEVEIHDPAQYETYKQMTPASIAAYGGRFATRGGHTELIEGTQQPKRIVLLEFPDTKTAKAWWASEEYRPAKELRQRIATTRMILTEGL